MSNTAREVMGYAELLSLLENRSSLPGNLLRRVSAPHVLPALHEWDNSRNRILIIGQETHGIEETLVSFPANDESIRRAAEAYRLFDFGRTEQHRPFWKAHQFLADRFESGAHRQVAWTNVVKLQSLREGNGSGSIFRLGREGALTIAGWQREYFLGELKMLRPSKVVFFTGPSYDVILQTVFHDLRFEAVPGSDMSVRKLALLEGRDLPRGSVRTYHPSYLQRSRQWHILETLVNFLSQDAA